MRTALRPTRLPLRSLLLGLVTLAACESPVPERSASPRLGIGRADAAQSPKDAPTQVPITDRETFEPRGGSIGCGTFGTLPSIYAGNGVTSQLGKVTSTSTWQECRVVGGRLVVAGTATLTGANGDGINVRFTQTFTEFVSGQHSAFVFDPWTIVGGTGRFTGATGSGRGTGTTTGPSMRGEWDISGTITPPGVSKRASSEPTVTIAAINQRTCDLTGCTSAPANLANVSDQIDVTLNVDPKGQSIASVQATLRCGEDFVTKTQIIAAPGDVVPPIIVNFNTAAFSPTGVVEFHNGQCSISASATTTGGTETAVASQNLTLNNADMAVVTVRSTNGTTDAISRPWIGGGPLTITAIPVMYSGRAAVAATLGMTGGTPTIGAVAPSPSSQAATLTAGAFSATWSNGSTAPTVRGYAAIGVRPVVSITDAGGTTITKIDSVTVRGGAAIELTPADFAFNLDEQKPAPGTFSVTNNPDQNAFSADGYIGATFRFVADSAAGYRGPDAVAGNQTANADHGGVDRVAVVFQFRLTGTANPYATVTSTAPIAEAFAGTYELRMITLDALGNADTTAAASTLKFGVDKTPPTAFATNGPANGASATGGGGNGAYTLGVGDGLSGIGPAFVAQVRLFNDTPTSVSTANEGRVNTNIVGAGLNPVNTSGATSADPCVIGRFNATATAAGANALPVFSPSGVNIGFCTPVAYNAYTQVGLSSDLSGTDGYFISEVVAADLAGNLATVLVRTALMDATAPTVVAIDLPAQAVGNSSVSFIGTVSDVASNSVGDIVGSWITQNFPAASLRYPTTAGPGVSFDNTLTRSTVVTAVIPRFIKNLQVGAASAVPVAGGNVTSVTVAALGAAQNVGALTAVFAPGFPQLVNGSASTFTAASVPGWAMQTPTNGNVTNCVNDSCSPIAPTQPTSITMTVTATGPTGTYANPFAPGTVQFWYRPTSNPVWYLIGTSGAASSRDNGLNRFWDYAITFNPPNFTPDLIALTTAGMTIEVMAIGVNSAGDAIATAAPLTLTIANP